MPCRRRRRFSIAHRIKVPTGAAAVGGIISLRFATQCHMHGIVHAGRLFARKYLDLWVAKLTMKLISRLISYGSSFMCSILLIINNQLIAFKKFNNSKCHILN
jgi:hypothetical protein